MHPELIGEKISKRILLKIEGKIKINPKMINKIIAPFLPNFFHSPINPQLYSNKLLQQKTLFGL